MFRRRRTPHERFTDWLLTLEPGEEFEIVTGDGIRRVRIVALAPRDPFDPTADRLARDRLFGTARP